MDARFAGSQRVGDRRRRRLAVGTDDHADNPSSDNPFRMDDLAAPAGSIRTVDGAHTNGPSTAPANSLNLPVSTLVPAAGWKYLVGGLLGLALSAVIVVAGYFLPRLPLIVGTGLSDLLALPNGRLAQWFSGFLLLLCAQLALFIWWARSRSLEDFEGRYWLWIRTAGVWLVLSGCLSTEAHNVALCTIHFLRPELTRTYANLCWMIPAAIVGVWLAGALVREMRGCRTSRAFLLAACAIQMSTAAVHLELDSFLSPAARAVVVQAGLLTAHVALFVSMWLHARHVLHFSADPAPGPGRVWRIPSPHFRLSKSRWMQAWHNRKKKKAVESETPLVAPKAARRRPAAEIVAESTNSQGSERALVSPDESGAERQAKPRIRFDGGHREPVRQTIPEIVAPQDDATDQFDAGTGPERMEEPAPATASLRNSAPARPPVPASQPPADASNGGAESEEADEAPDEGPREGPSKPELRGMSKKQRRRLMQELRERERNSR
jgi:hypothetical protein